MIRFAAATALFASLLLVPVTASPAANGRQDQFRAELTTPATRDRLVVRDIVWRCEGASCVASAGASRTAVVCAALAREAGPLRSFAMGSQPLAPEQLEKCNASAH
jgi:hypothetical protein